MVAKLLVVVCIQAVLLKGISAQGYGIPGIVNGCGCGNSIPISVSNCGCSNNVPALSVSNCGCSNTIPTVSMSNCGCSNTIPAVSVSNCGCSNNIPAVSVSNCGCSNTIPAVSVSNCGCSNNIPAVSMSNCGCSNNIPSVSVSNSVSTIPVSSCGYSNSNFGYSKTTTASTGGPLSVTCYGPISTNGVSVLAELGIQGDVEVVGTLPFLSAVVLDGTLPTSGMAAVNYGCGDGNIVILQENGNPSGNNAASSTGLSLASVGAGACGCRY